MVNKPQSTVAELAKNVGMMFFNILRLHCIEPVYPKICVESTIYYRISRLLGWDVSKSNHSSGQEGCNRWEEDADADPTDIRFMKLTKPF